MTQYAVHTLWSCRKENTIRIYLWALMFIELRRCVLRHKYRLCQGLPSSRWYATKHQRLHPPSLQPSPSPLNSRSPPPPFTSHSRPRISKTANELQLCSSNSASFGFVSYWKVFVKTMLLACDNKVVAEIAAAVLEIAAAAWVAGTVAKTMQ